jgi:hypothetical protein
MTREYAQNASARGQLSIAGIQIRALRDIEQEIGELQARIGRGG